MQSCTRTNKQSYFQKTLKKYNHSGLSVLNLMEIFVENMFLRVSDTLKEVKHISRHNLVDVGFYYIGMRINKIF